MTDTEIKVGDLVRGSELGRWVELGLVLAHAEHHDPDWSSFEDRPIKGCVVYIVKTAEYAKVYEGKMLYRAVQWLEKVA